MALGAYSCHDDNFIIIQANIALGLTNITPSPTFKNKVCEKH